ncbi:hypothetical protein BH11ACT8_BH11ACT8_17830 [soil metagenome]
MLAHVSASYYTALEQDRATRPTAAVLDALAEALHLTGAQRSHLHTLAGLAAPVTPAAPDVAGLAGLVTALAPRPSYVTDESWFVLCLNGAAAELLPGVEPGTNLVAWMLTDTRAREVFVEWESETRAQLARLRATAARSPGERTWLAQLLAADARAARWWDAHEVAPLSGGVKRLVVAGVERSLGYQVLVPADSPETHLVVFDDPGTR